VSIKVSDSDLDTVPQNFLAGVKIRSVKMSFEIFRL
jgi:hypothetical protein